MVDLLLALRSVKRQLDLRAPTWHGWPIARSFGWIALLSGVFLAGCARSQYRRAADEDTYAILHQKSCATPWELSPGFSVVSDPRSRLFYPCDADDPELPYPGPHLYSYELPALKSQALEAQTAANDAETIDGSSGYANTGDVDAEQVSWLSEESREPIAAPMSQPGGTFGDGQPNEFAPRPLDIGDRPTSPEASDTDMVALPIQPIPARSWNAIPPQCLSRMLEFARVRDEYQRMLEFAGAGEEYQEQDQPKPLAELRDPSRKLTFNEIVELALLNSREYQTQKEQLYSAALALTFVRYDYLAKFSTGGNGTDVDYNHSRSAGTTVNTLGIPSTLQAEKMLAVGGDFLARFANDVVLTFNGPQGFTADVSSELLFNLSQSVFQRDVLLNPLIQSERNVVYQARDFTRFRRNFFLQLAREYYSLLQTYRRIEIDAQNYFSLVRALDQAEEEVQAAVQDAPPQFEIDQIEQRMLAGQSSLIGSCNSLEASLDRLKLTMGLPTEMPINLDLTELEWLTLRDEIEVVGELVRRTRSRVDAQLAGAVMDHNEIVSTDIVLIERLLEWLRLRGQLGEEMPDLNPLEELRYHLRVDEARLEADRARTQLEDLEPKDEQTPPPPPILRFQRTMHLLQALFDLVGRQLELAERLNYDPQTASTIAKTYREFQSQAADLRYRLDTLVQEGRAAELGTMLLPAAASLLRSVEGLTRTADPLIGAPLQRPALAEALENTIERTEQLLRTSESLMADAQAGLVPVDMNVDDAMVTALVQRLDLMNERGALADDWRAIKLAADDLKSVLNLNASQSIRTRETRPFGFSTDDSTTRLNMSFDLPLNRLSQRNSYRRSLIGYQAGSRSLTAFEDDVKLDIRDGLRQLDLDRVQYNISVASAALASERVFTTRLELALALGNVRVEDFLNAQDASRVALTRVADLRIGYILERAQFALDLEQMVLDDSGFWPEIHNERYQPQPNPVYPANAGPVYGEISPRVKVSPPIKRMLCYPPPGLQAFSVEPRQDLDGLNVPRAIEPLPVPAPNEIEKIGTPPAEPFMVPEPPL